jgi:LAO/AO transport system kinase
MSKTINPNIKKIIKKHKTKEYTAEEYCEGIKKGDRNFLSKAISILESNKAEKEKLSAQIVSLCMPYSGKSRRIGITGVPGVGKSTFIDILVYKLIEKGHKVAILAIDPSSSISGGSILGDKTRMTRISGRTEVFIRPSPTGGTLGGVASKTRETMILCEAAGFDTIFIETVGVGQSEIAVASMVDLFIMLLVAGTGDELQGIKRGIMELVDILIFTKDDSDNILRTKIAKKQFQNALRMFPPKISGWIPQTISISSTEIKGIDNAIELINKYFEYIKSTNFFDQNRKNQLTKWFYDQINYLLQNSFFGNEKIATEIKKIEQQIQQNKISPISAANTLIHKFLKEK